MASIQTDTFASQVAANYLGRGKSKTTVRQFRQVLRELRELGFTETEQLTDIAITEWIAAWPDRSPETFRSHLRALAVLCKRAKKLGHLSLNPFSIDDVGDWMRADSRPAAAKRRWSKPIDQIKAMLAQADYNAERVKWARDLDQWKAERDQAYAWTLFLTGARPGEIQRLRVEDFNARRKTLEIVAHWIAGRGGRKTWWKPKTEGSAGVLPIGDYLTRLLLKWRDRLRYRSKRDRLRITDCNCLFPGEKLWGPWTGGCAGERPLDRIRALGKQAGVLDLTQKAARKGIGTYREIELTPQGRRDYFRHSDDATGDLYDERDPEARRGDAIKIERFFTGT